MNRRTLWSCYWFYDRLNGGLAATCLVIAVLTTGCARDGNSEGQRAEKDIPGVGSPIESVIDVPSFDTLLRDSAVIVYCQWVSDESSMRCVVERVLAHAPSENVNHLVGTAIPDVVVELDDGVDVDYGEGAIGFLTRGDPPESWAMWPVRNACLPETGGMTLDEFETIVRSRRSDSGEN